MIGALRDELRRTNFAGREVSLAEGALVTGGVVALSLRTGRVVDPCVLAGIGTLGMIDDLLEPRQRRAGRPVSKGLRGHLGTLLEGQLTTGAAKALGIPLLSLTGALAAPAPRGRAMMLVDAALVAGCANLANLLDLRPGRVLKAALPPAALLLLVPARADRHRADRDRADSGCADRGRTGRQLALAALLPGLLALPADLRERGMLGDAGANVLGAAVGSAATRVLPAPARISLLAAVVALTLASEKVSFSAVIDSTAPLRRLDQLGRLPVATAGPGPTAGPGATAGASPAAEEER